MNRIEKLKASRWIPKGSAKVASKNSSAVAYLFGSKVSGRCCAVGYVGDAGKPAINYSFKDAAARAKYVAHWMKGCDAAAVYKAEQAAKKKAALAKPHGLKVGDVLSGSWGYDQTNVDFYEVVAVIGKRSVDIRELQQERADSEGLFMQGECMPLPGQYRGDKVLRKMVDAYDRISMTSYLSLSKAEKIIANGVELGFKPCHFTAYA